MTNQENEARASASGSEFEVHVLGRDAVEYQEGHRALRVAAEPAANGLILYADADARRWQPPHSGESIPLADLREIQIRITVVLARSGLIVQWVAPTDPSWQGQWEHHWADIYREEKVK
jgi:hypothetical protein